MFLERRVIVTLSSFLVVCAVLATVLVIGVFRIVRARQAPLIPVEVLVGNRQQQRALRRSLVHGVRRLCVLFGGDLPADLVVVQEVLDVGKARGCHCTVRRPDGSSATVIRLALHVEGRRMTTDELLAALADQCLVLLARTAQPEGLRLLSTPPRRSNGIAALFPGRDSDLHRNPDGA